MLSLPKPCSPVLDLVVKTKSVVGRKCISSRSIEVSGASVRREPGQLIEVEPEKPRLSEMTRYDSLKRTAGMFMCFKMEGLAED